MALGQIHRGVRELVRVTMRERGIRHRSYKNEIRSITYAQQPTRSVEYEGPIFITYEEPIVRIVCYGGTTEDLAHDDPVLRRRVKDCSWLNATDLEQYRLEEHVVSRTGIDIHDPKFCDILGKFLDKHVHDQNKRPAKWKRLYRDTDEEYYFVPTTIQLNLEKKSKFLTVKQAIIRWMMLKFFKIDPASYEQMSDWYWRETIKRHFRCDQEDLEQINQTVTALRNSDLSNEEVEHNTAQIMSGNETEY